MPPTKSAPARQRRRATPAEAVLPEQTDDVLAEPETTWLIDDGRRVVSDEPAPAPLPARAGQQPITFKTLRLLTLDNGTHRFGCGECRTFVGSRGDVQRHRISDHNAPRPGRRPTEPPIPADLSAMTLGELADMSRDAANWGILVTDLEIKLDDWRTRALAAEQWQRKVVNQLARMGFTLAEDDD